MSPENAIRKMLTETYMPMDKPPKDPKVLTGPENPPRDPNTPVQWPDAVSDQTSEELAARLRRSGRISSPPPAGSPRNQDYPPSKMPANVIKGLGDKSYMKPQEEKPKKLGENRQINRAQIIQETLSLLIEKGVKGLAREFEAISKGVRRAQYTAGTLGADNNNHRIWVNNPKLAQQALGNVDTAMDKSAVLAAKASYKLQRSQYRFNRRILQDPNEQNPDNIAMLGRIRASRERRAELRGEAPPPRLKMKDIKTISQLAQRHKDLLSGTVRMAAAHAGLDSDSEGIIRLKPDSYMGRYARGDLHPLTGREYSSPERVARSAHIISGQLDQRVPQIEAPRRTEAEVRDHFANVEIQNKGTKEFMAGPNRRTSAINNPIDWGRTPVGGSPLPENTPLSAMERAARR